MRHQRPGLVEPAGAHEQARQVAGGGERAAVVLAQGAAPELEGAAVGLAGARGVAAPLLQRAQVAEQAHVGGVVLALGGGDDGHGAPVVARGGFQLAQVLGQAGQFAVGQSRVGAGLAEQAQAQFQVGLLQRARLAQPAARGQGHGQGVAGDPDLVGVLAVELQLAGQGLAQHGLGALQVAPLPVQQAEVVQDARAVPAVGRQVAAHLQRAPERGLGLVQPLQLHQRQAQRVPGAGRDHTLLAGRLQQGQRAARGLLGLAAAAFVGQQRGQVVEGGGRTHRLPHLRRLQRPGGLAQQLLGAGRLADVGVGLPHQLLHARVHLRGVGQRGDARRAGVQQLAHGDLVPAPAGPARIGRLEDAQHELADLLGHPRLALGAVARLAQAPDESGHQADHQRGHRGRLPVPAQGPAQAVQRSALPRQHRPAFEVALQVVGEGLHRAVAAVRRQGAGTGRDRVQVAAQPRPPRAVAPGQAAGRRHRDVPVPGLAAHRPAGQQLGQDHAQAEHVRGHADRPAVQRLGRGVGRRAEGRAVALDGIGQAGDAEIQQHRLAVRAHQHVAGLEVAVHHQVCVRGLHRAADAQEQLQPLAQAGLAGAAPGVQRLPLDQLHHQVREAGRGGAAVVQVGDVGMAQPGQDAPLGGQALGAARVRQPVQKLHRHLALVQAVGALGPVHHAHAAGTQALAQPPRAEHVARLQLGRGHARQQAVQRRTRALQRHRLRAQQLQRLADQRRVAGTPGQLLVPGLGRQVAHRIEQVAQLPPAFLAHPAPCPHGTAQASWRLSQARAKRRSRSTVGTDTSSTVAISSCDMPPK